MIFIKDRIDFRKSKKILKELDNKENNKND